MVNKRGQALPLAGGGAPISAALGKPAIWILIVIIVLAIGFTVYGFSKGFSSRQDFANAFSQPSVGFEEDSIFGSDLFRPLNYIFGKIPAHLAEWTQDSEGNSYGAAIILIGIWLMFFLVFADIIGLFGFFSNAAVSWIVSALFVVILANLKVIIAVSAIALAVMAVFGALSVLASIALVFGFFLAFHFGTAPFRQWLIYRRTQDYALKSMDKTMRGAADAAAGMTALRTIAGAAKGGP